jgi:putative nucleotidyltransferase with HDIG domain
MLRAVRFSAQLGFAIEQNTLLAIKECSPSMSSVSRERVRDELSKLLMSNSPMSGLEFLRFTDLTKNILPELLLGLHMKQTINHKHDVYSHLLWSCQHAADKGYSLEMRLAALLHDIAKPHTARLNKETGWNTFYGHEVVGESVSREILTRLKYSKEVIEKVCKLVRWHMFNSDPDQVTMSAVRRMVANVGKENIWDLMNLRFCDRIGSGRPVEEPHRLRRYFTMIEQALTDPIDLKMLKINGNVIMNVTHETPGPRLRYLLFALFGEVLENPALNTTEYLVSRVTELAKLSTPELIELAKKGELEQEELEDAQLKDIKKKYRV